jgi:2-polyprenyl-3-methyl-5-hydroxy-6-metoxy-1,4-benzoquinol methylase
MVVFGRWFCSQAMTTRSGRCVSDEEPMFAVTDPPSMDSWLADIRVYVGEKAPHMLSILDIYLGEARFGRQYINDDLVRLHQGAMVLEVGAGSMLLSCQLVREGFQVTALEPTGAGFSHFESMRKLVLRRAEILGCLPRMLDQSTEALSEKNCFDYAFSVNVMEHVKDIALSIGNVGYGLKHGAIYRFTCPNYLFPYEPHFNIPTLFSKRLTQKLLGGQIFGNKSIPDPEGTWKSLNWIDVIQIRRSIKSLPELNVAFHRWLLVSILERVVSDKGFSKRRPKWMCVVIAALVQSRLHHVFGLLPVMLQPIIDCTVTRTGFKGVS